MLQYRPFCNLDPPQLAEIWRSQPPGRGLMQPMSAATLERLVLSKPTFDRFGLVVADEGDRLLGFAHAGFGPGQGGTSLSLEKGVTSIVMVRPEVGADVSARLIRECESYLQRCGAESLYGGGHYPLSPFYYGLYGGSEISGVLDSDVRMSEFFRSAGYTVAERSLVMQRELAGFRPLVDRQQMQIRRQTTLETIVDPQAKNWWEAITFEPFDRTHCFLQPRQAGDHSASVNFWNMDTMLGAWGVRAVGIWGLEVAATKRRQGLATYLVGEALRQLHSQGVMLAEVHVRDDNDSAVRLFRALGFEQVDQAMLYRKDISSACT